MRNEKKYLYIFLHTPKCAGRTINFHLKNNYKKEEYLEIDLISKNKENARKIIKDYLKKNKENMKEVKVIYGHEIFYGIHKFFPGREARYFTFVRNPIERTISSYNYQITEYEKFKKKAKEDPEKNRIFEKFKRLITKKGKIISFKKWLKEKYNNNDRDVANKTMLKFFEDAQFYKRDKSIEEGINKIFKKFWFIGLTENPEDMEFIYSILDINKFFEDRNISKKYFVLDKEDKKTHEYLKNKNKEDVIFYNIAKEENKKFKINNLYYKKLVKKIKIKRKMQKIREYIKNPFLLSKELKEKYPLYKKLLNNLKGT